MKKVSKIPCNKDHLVSAKKAKLSTIDTKTNKRYQKSKADENRKNNTPQIIDEAACSNTTNEIIDNSSESEYIPSDDDSGNSNI